MTAKRIALLCTLLLTLLVAPGADARPQVDWDQPLNLSLAKADLGEVLKSFAKIAGGTLVADLPLDGEVTVELVRTPVAAALGQICHDHDLRCEWHEKSARLSVVPATEGGFRGLSTRRISIELRGASLQQTLDAMGAITEGAVRVEGEFEGSVTLDVDNVAWQQALEMLCADSGCAVDWAAEPVRVTPRGDGADEVTVELSEPDDAEAPAARTLSVRFAPDGAVPTEAVTTFDWTAPVRRMASGDWRLHLAWLPFDPPRLLRLVERCADDAWPIASAPVPLTARVSLDDDWAGGAVRIRSLDPSTDNRPAGVDAEPCPAAAPASRLVAAVREHGRTISETELPPAPGSYVMIEPAGTRSPLGSTGPELAVVRLGQSIAAGGIEEHRVLFIRAHEPGLQTASIVHGTPHVEAFGPWSLEVALRAN